MLFPVAAWLALFACKTTSKNEESAVSYWANDEEMAHAREKFKQTIHDCVPLITAVVPGAKTLKTNSDPKQAEVVELFVNQLVSDPKPKTERAAMLLRYYYNEKGRIFPPCGGEGAEYVLTEFAVHTNAIAVAFGEEAELKIID